MGEEDEEEEGFRDLHSQVTVEVKSKELKMLDDEEEGCREVTVEVKSKELKMLLGCDRVALVPSLSDTVRP